MKKFEYIFFDCMETLVDLHKLPLLRDYASWAFDGSGAEERWESFDDFFRYYLLAKQDLSSRLPEHADYEMRGRFLHTIKLSLPDLPYILMESVAEKLYSNYWRNYKAGSYVREDVREVVDDLSENYKMGVVSNFMITNGIEELLEMHDMKKYFDFVVTSVAEGWRKPHPAIYSKAMEIAHIESDKVLFVGDDFVNDFVTPKKIGMAAIYLDRFDRHPELDGRVRDFHDLREILS